MEKTAMMQPMRSAMAVQRAAVTPINAPSTTDPPAAPARRAISGAKPATDRVSISNEAQRLNAAGSGGATPNTGGNDRLENANPRSMSDRVQSMISELKASFLTRAGEEGFNEKFDFNSDGIINAGDLGIFREKVGSMAQPGAMPLVTPPDNEGTQVPVTSTAQPNAEPASSELTLDALRSAFHSRDGDDRFNAAADLNGDGMVNVRDLGLFQQAQSGVADPVQPVPQPVTAVNPSSQPVAGVAPSGDLASPETVAPSEGSVEAGVSAVVNPAVTQEADTSGATTEVDAAEIRANLLDQLREAFFSQTGDDRFNASLDANNDGLINLIDMVQVRDQV